jgi:hypothetical protein
MSLAFRIAAPAAAIAAALLLLAGCGQKERSLGPAGDPPQFTGVQLHPLWSGVSPRQAARELDLARRHGADMVRIDIGWSSLELDRKGRISRPYARRIDAFLDHARKRRVKVIGTLLGTPCWASSAPASLRQRCRGEWWERDVDRYPPRRARDFGDAAGYVARRWGRRLHALEIWNEPNLPAFLRSDDPAGSYARLVRAAYRPVKRAAPQLTVLAGAMLQSDGDFLDALYERGDILGHYDAISYHPYSSAPAEDDVTTAPESSFIRGTRRLREIMVAHGDPDPELWATEAGASTCPRSLNRSCVSRSTQAARVADYIRVARRFPYLRAIVIYNLRDKGDHRVDIENGYGLVSRSLRAKPALHAFRDAAGANR